MLVSTQMITNCNFILVFLRTCWRNPDEPRYRLRWSCGRVCWGSGCSSWRELRTERRCAGMRSSDCCRGGRPLEPARMPVWWSAGRLDRHRWRHCCFGWGCGSVHEHHQFCCCSPVFPHVTPELLKKHVALRGWKLMMEKMNEWMKWIDDIKTVSMSTVKLPAWSHPNLNSLTHTIPSLLERTFLILTKAESS